jgi:hypothetical protein
LLYNYAILLGSASLSVALTNMDAIYMLILAILISRFWPGIFREATDRKTLLTKAVAILMIVAGVFAINLGV